jgi:DNA-binding response OmpR family regulator
MTKNVRCLDFVFVVDENSIDYKQLVDELRRTDIRTNVYSTGEAALRARRISASTVWIVNVRLPDISGVEFVALIRRRLRRCKVFLVGNKYSVDDELAARTAGATGYLCKPATASWLKGCRVDAGAQAIRAGPAPYD